MNKEESIKRYLELEAEMDKIGQALASQCLEEIQPLLDKKEYQKAKDYARKFYTTSVNENGCFESIDKVILFCHINNLMKEEKC